MFTVVIPLYNKEKQIRTTIQTVLEQTFQQYEILIINDGSTDGSIEEVQKFSDKRIRIISQKNAGVSAARNTGIENARYEWVAFLDADDLWEKDFLKEISVAILKYSDTSIFATGRSTARNCKILRYQNPYLPKDGETDYINFFENLAKFDCPITSSSVVIKKILFSEKGFFKTGQRNYEDVDLWIRLCVNENVVVVNKPLAIYVIQEGESASKLGYTSQDCVRMLNTYLEVRDKLKSNEDKRNLKAFYERHCNMVVLRFFNQYEKRERKEILRLMSEILERGEYYKLKIIQMFGFRGVILFAKRIKSRLLQMKGSS